MGWHDHDHDAPDTDRLLDALLVLVPLVALAALVALLLLWR